MPPPAFSLAHLRKPYHGARSDLLRSADASARQYRHDPALRPNLRQIYPDRCACTRSGIIFVPVILILSHSFGLFGIEISQSLADILSAAVTIPFSSLSSGRCQKKMNNCRWTYPSSPAMLEIMLIPYKKYERKEAPELTLLYIRHLFYSLF